MDPRQRWQRENNPQALEEERDKKPPSRFTEDAGFVSEPPKSTKKKGIKGDDMEGMSSKPLLINDWSDVQLLKYCNSCGINFTEVVHDCINHIRSLELQRNAKEQAETSSEVRET